VKYFVFLTALFVFLSLNARQEPVLSSLSSPTAAIQAEQLKLTGTEILLDGSSSHDPEGGTLSFFWSLSHQPAASHVFFSEQTSEKTKLFLDQPGSYIARLQVKNSEGKTDSTFVTFFSVPSAGEVVFGPQVFMPDIFCLFSFVLLDCSEERVNFSVSDSSREFFLVAENQGLEDAFIDINGESVTGPFDFAPEVTTVARSVPLEPQNENSGLHPDQKR